MPWLDTLLESPPPSPATPPAHSGPQTLPQQLHHLTACVFKHNQNPIQGPPQIMALILTSQRERELLLGSKRCSNPQGHKPFQVLFQDLCWGFSQVCTLMLCGGHSAGSKKGALLPGRRVCTTSAPATYPGGSQALNGIFDFSPDRVSKYRRSSGTRAGRGESHMLRDRGAAWPWCGTWGEKDPPGPTLPSWLPSLGTCPFRASLSRSVHNSVLFCATSNLLPSSEGVARAPPTTVLTPTVPASPASTLQQLHDVVSLILSFRSGHRDSGWLTDLSRS